MRQRFISVAGPRSASQAENITEFTTCQENARQFFRIVSKCFDRATSRSMLTLIKKIKSFNSLMLQVCPEHINKHEGLIEYHILVRITEVVDRLTLIFSGEVWMGPSEAASSGQRWKGQRSKTVGRYGGNLWFRFPERLPCPSGDDTIHCDINGNKVRRAPRPPRRRDGTEAPPPQYEQAS